MLLVMVSVMDWFPPGPKDVALEEQSGDLVRFSIAGFEGYEEVCRIVVSFDWCQCAATKYLGERNAMAPTSRPSLEFNLSWWAWLFICSSAESKAVVLTLASVQRPNAGSRST